MNAAHILETTRLIPTLNVRSRILEVAPPTRQDLRDYENTHKKIGSIWNLESKQKTINYDSGSGTVFFQFINSEYDIPQTDEEREWVEEAMNDDAKDLKRRQGLLSPNEG